MNVYKIIPYGPKPIVVGNREGCIYALTTNRINTQVLQARSGDMYCSTRAPGIAPTTLKQSHVLPAGIEPSNNQLYVPRKVLL